MENCYQTTKKILSLLKVKHTTKYLEDTVYSHPFYPSLLSISDTLEKYSINTLGVNLELDKLKKIPLPCVVQIKKNGSSFFYILTSVNDTSVIYYNESNKLITSSTTEFLEIWTGVCLLLETTNETKEKGIDKKLHHKRILSVFRNTLTILLLAWFTTGFLGSEVSHNLSSSLYVFFYLLLKVAGLTVGIVLLWFEIDQYNPKLQKFCSGGNKKVNCNSVLTSKYSRLLNGAISLSILVVSYFFSTLFYLAIQGFSIPSLSNSLILSLSTFPIVLTSIYYQAIVIRQWCKFCIMVQVILLTESSILYFGSFYNGVHLNSIHLLFGLILLPIIAWKYLKPLLNERKKINLFSRSLNKIKSNPSVLESLLSQSSKIEVNPEGLGISIQNKSAKFNIVKVCNPYCGPCASAHPILEELVNDGTINLQIIFTSDTDPVKHLMAIDELDDTEIIQKALDDWYLAEEKNYTVFSSKYPLNGEVQKQSSKIQAMKEWCDKQKIVHTPTIFINGFEIPNEYNVSDLRNVLT
jgi:uncharacterized membrane protein/thiol-disulfide isomerase/thioredoxin